MTSTKITYPPEAILKLALAITQDEAAIKWLNINYRELAAIYDSLVNGNKKAFDWLKRNNHFLALAFISALDTSRKGFHYLMNNNAKEWAACVNASKDDRGARDWLYKYNYTNFVFLAEVLYAQYNSSGNAIGGYDGEDYSD